MNSTPNITNEERSILLNHYYETAKRLRDNILGLQQELYEAEKRIDELSSFSGFYIENESSEIYQSSWPLARKAEYVLNHIKQVANTRTIAEVINLIEGNLMNDQVVREMVSSLGATLKQKVDRDIVFNRIEEHNDIFYGLREWFAIDFLTDSLVVKIEYDRKHKKSYIERK